MLRRSGPRAVGIRAAVCALVLAGGVASAAPAVAAPGAAASPADAVWASGSAGYQCAYLYVSEYEYICTEMELNVVADRAELPNGRVVVTHSLHANWRPGDRWVGVVECAPGSAAWDARLYELPDLPATDGITYVCDATILDAIGPDAAAVIGTTRPLEFGLLEGYEYVPEGFVGGGGFGSDHHEFSGYPAVESPVVIKR